MSDGVDSGGEGPLKTATAIVGLLAGLAATVYVLGGLVIALRMLVEGFAIGSVGAIVGQLPRELVVTTALLGVALPAAIFGLLAIGVSEVLREARKMPTDHPNNLAEVAVMAVVSLLLVLPGALLLLGDSRGWVVRVVLLFGWGFAFLFACVSWRRIKQFASERRGTRRFPSPAVGPPGPGVGARPATAAAAGRYRTASRARSRPAANRASNAPGHPTAAPAPAPTVSQRRR